MVIIIFIALKAPYSYRLVIKIATIKTLNNGESGLEFRTNLNDNFTSLNTELKTHDDNIAMLDSDVEQNTNDIVSLKSTSTQHTNAIQTLQTATDNLKGGYDKIQVTSSTSNTGFAPLPDSPTADSVQLVDYTTYNNEVTEQNTQIHNIIKGSYLSAGTGVELTKTDSGVTISATGSGGVDTNWQHSNPNLLMNWDWRHPSSHRGIYTFIKNNTDTETKAHPSIDCWEINFSNAQGVGYTFYDAEENRFAAFQGTSPTDPGDMTTYATISQSFPDDWGDFLIGKKMTFSVAVSDSYAEYQNNQYYVYSYTFTANQGYTGWLTFPYPSQMQFGIHFNTELDGRIENEITLRFNNIWVHALKLEIGETETLTADLMKPVDCYKQARDCEEYIQSAMLDGLTMVSDLDGYTGDTSNAEFAEIQNYEYYIQGDKVYINVPLKKPLMSKPRIEVWNANGLDMTYDFDQLNDKFVYRCPFTLYTNENAVPSAYVKYGGGAGLDPGTLVVPSIQISNFVSGSNYIQLVTDYTSLHIAQGIIGNSTTIASKDELQKLYSAIAVLRYNLIFTCEESWDIKEPPSFPEPDAPDVDMPVS